ncbi:MAG: hypothetical protein CMH53_02070 [Myxococcales bacterium]|nr:hypothetical protein [Myxococcales bacterium]
MVIALWSPALWAKATLANAGSDHVHRLGGQLSHMLLATASLWLIAAGLSWRATRSNTGLVIQSRWKLTHVLPASLQLVIFCYWGLYWRALPLFLPALGLQVLWAYGLDAALQIAKKGKWTLSAGPIPIVLSSNLIVLFDVHSWPLSLLVVTVAIGSRSWLRRAGRHVFNPSALGVAAVGALNLLWPDLGYGDRAHEFSIPPHMTELVLLLALIVQIRLPVVLVTGGATLSLWGLRHLGLHVLSPEWAPVTLILLLFITDPATTPKTQIGRLLFGGLVGLLMGLMGHGLEAIGYSDFYAKVLPLPLVNVASPWLDDAGRWLVERVKPIERPLARQWNWAHVALWLLLMVPSLMVSQRPRPFDTAATIAHHRENQTPFVNFEGATISCQQSPMYCGPFRFDLELRAWLSSPSGRGHSGSGR